VLSRSKIIIIIVIIIKKMGHECKRGTIGGAGRTGKERVQGVESFKVYYMYMYEDSKMKPTKYCLE
jgi:hypothetical protein